MSLISGSLGYRRKIFPESGEIVKVLAGRSYATGSNSNPLAGNTMADNLELGKAYQVPAGRKLTILSYHFSWSLLHVPASILLDLAGREILPIGQGTTTTTTDFAGIMHVDFQFNGAQVVENDQGTNYSFFADESGDCERVVPAGYYPKVGTTTRTAGGIAPGTAGLRASDLMLWGIEGPAD